MADEKRDDPRPFDVTTVEYLLKLMTEHDLSEVDLKEGDQRIRLRKGMAYPSSYMPPPVASHAPPAVAPPVTPAAPAGTADATASSRKLLEIKSPTPGTFYARPKPDKPDFVAVGNVVKPDTIVCLIEAMKLYNDIKAELSGTIVEVCIKNGDPVEYGTVLFRVEPS